MPNISTGISTGISTDISTETAAIDSVANSYSFAIPENSGPGTVVGRMTGGDGDNDPIVYSLTGEAGLLGVAPFLRG